MAFDTQSGIRERLALVARLGPALDTSGWGYHPSRDFWYWCGSREEQPTIARVNVSQEGSESLRLIQERWSMDDQTAMAFIGYPRSK